MLHSCAVDKEASASDRFRKLVGLIFESVFPLPCFNMTILPIQSIYCLEGLLDEEHIKHHKSTLAAWCNILGQNRENMPSVLKRTSYF